MTGYTVHTGASKKFVSGWDRIFSSDTKKDGAAKSSERGDKGKKTKGKKRK